MIKRNGCVAIPLITVLLIHQHKQQLFELFVRDTVGSTDVRTEIGRDCTVDTVKPHKHLVTAVLNPTTVIRQQEDSHFSHLCDKGIANICVRTDIVFDKALCNV